MHKQNNIAQAVTHECHSNVINIPINTKFCIDFSGITAHWFIITLLTQLPMYYKSDFPYIKLELSL